MVRRSISAACRASTSGGAPAHDRLSARIASTRSSNASHLHQPYLGHQFTCSKTSLQSKCLLACRGACQCWDVQRKEKHEYCCCLYLQPMPVTKWAMCLPRSEDMARVWRVMTRPALPLLNGGGSRLRTGMCLLRLVLGLQQLQLCGMQCSVILFARSGQAHFSVLPCLQHASRFLSCAC